MRVDFFICGVQKGGTTALDQFLRTHPDLQMGKQKEIHFFDNESLDWRSPPYDHFHREFDFDIDCLRGEATPIYTYWPNALERIHAYNPRARLIMLLRNPVLRAFSHWRMERTRGDEPWPFSQAIRDLSRVRQAPGGVHRIYSYVDRGFYAAQIERMRRLFPSEQILFLRTDALWSDPVGTLSKVQAFLGVAPRLSPEQRYVVPIETDKSVPLLEEDALYLTALYAADIRATETLAQLDLGDWLTLPSFEAEAIRR